MKLISFEKVEKDLYFIIEENDVDIHYAKANEEGELLDSFLKVGETGEVIVPFNEFEVEDYIRFILSDTPLSFKKGAKKEFCKIRLMYDLSVIVYEEIVAYLTECAKSGAGVTKETIEYFKEDLQLKCKGFNVSSGEFSDIFTREMFNIDKDLEEE